MSSGPDAISSLTRMAEEPDQDERSHLSEKMVALEKECVALATDAQTTQAEAAAKALAKAAHLLEESHGV